MKPKPLKLRRCKQCGTKFQPERPLQGVCSWACSIKYQAKLSEKLKQKKWRDEKKVMIEKLKTHKDYLKELQIIFNTFIRLRDAKQTCISCDCSMEGRKGDASHYYASGSNPALRFNEDNVHLSCVPCNQFKHGNLIEYGLRLPLRIGTARFESLAKLRNEPLKITIPELKELIKTYKKRIKENPDLLT